MPTLKKYDELREHAVRLVFESKRPIAHALISAHKEALRWWVRAAQAEASGRQVDRKDRSAA